MRIQVNLSDEMVEKLNDYSKLIGVSRSSLVAVWLGQLLAGADKAMNTIENVAQASVSTEDESLSDLLNKVQE